MNLPNKLSILRVILVPVFVLVLVLPTPAAWDAYVRILAAAVFILTALTDLIDGKIARKFNMVTDFGKFIDPLADKFMVFGALLAMVYRFCINAGDSVSEKIFCFVFVLAVLVVIFRELAITSLRLLVVNKSGTVVAAAWLGKVKTVTQVVCILFVLLEPVLVPGFVGEWHIISYVTIGAMVIMTLWSGIDYVKAYWGQLDPTK